MGLRVRLRQGIDWKGPAQIEDCKAAGRMDRNLRGLLNPHWRSGLSPVSSPEKMGDNYPNFTQ